MAGIEAFGVDGSEFIEGTPFCSRIDLSENAMHHIERFERALCVEVGEHIPATYEATLLDNLVGDASENAIIVLSWAVIGRRHRTWQRASQRARD